MMNRRTFSIALTSAAALTAVPAQAASDPIYTSWRSDVAAGGYDVVSYFSGNPVEGRSEFSTRYKGAEFRFSTAANRDLFTVNPDGFVPQYGGYCAWACAKGKLAKGDPKYWHVRDGKLYLNFSRRIQERWERDIPGFIRDADRNWPEILA